MLFQPTGKQQNLTEIRVKSTGLQEFSGTLGWFWVVLFAGDIITNKLQIKSVVCCTLNQWFLHIEVVGGLLMPTNECNKGGELLATGQLSTHPTGMSSDKETLPAIGTPLFTKQSLFCSTSLIGVSGAG